MNIVGLIDIEKRNYQEIDGFVRDVATHVKANVSELLSDSNNLVYGLDDKYVLKLLLDKSTNNTVERGVINLLNQQGYQKCSKQLLHNGEVEIQGAKYQYDISRFIPGDFLDASNIEDTDLQKILNIIDEIASINVQGFGRLNNKLIGEEIKWNEFIRAYMEKQKRKSQKVVKIFGWQLDVFLHDFYELLDVEKGCLLAMDLNQKNFVKSGNDIQLNNLPVVWSGDKFAMYGEYLAHFFDHLEYKDLNEFFSISQDELKKVYVYCYFMLFTIFVFVENNKYGFDITNEKPWGGEKTIYYLLNIVYERICSMK